MASPGFFAQHGEDEKLASLVDLSRPGFYIDIGAWHPSVDSVTKWFYDRGWSGMNFEPNPAYHLLLEDARPRDINLPWAVGDEKGFLEFHIIENTGLSTGRREYATALGHHGSAVRTISVPVFPLASIANQIATEVDFMKIDVEGWEEKVIRGNDWTKLRPKILVIEATVPATDIPDWDSWDHLVVEAGYDFLEFDGLNRWYRAQ